jgi:hypothetical protein
LFSNLFGPFGSTLGAPNTAGGGTSPNYVIALDDWSTGSAVQIGTLTLNVDNGIITPQDSTLASHYSGGIQTWRSASSIIHGPAGEQFEFGAMMFTVTNGAFDSTDLYQVLVGCKPYARWATYPFSDTFNKATDITHPAPFKIRILNGSGALVTTLQMQDGLPINSPSLSQDRSPYGVFDANFGNESAPGYADSPPLRPFFNCAMMLPWQNKRPKPLPSARVKIPQNDLSSYRPSQAKIAFASNAMSPMAWLGGSNSQLNATNQWHAAPKWPMGPVNPAWSRGNDPYVDVNTYAGGQVKRAWTISGWGYEPGSISTHDWITGPGGSRFDRWQIPTPAAYYLADPTWVRPLDTDGSTIVDHVQNFGMAYFNHSCHYLQNVKTFETISNTKATFYNNVYGESWYGGSSTPAANMVNAVATRFQTSSYYYDKNGNRFWNNWVLDDQHAHQQPGLWSYAFGSPMHMVSTRHLTTASQMSTLGNGPPASFWAVNSTSANAPAIGFPKYVITRTLAYRMAKFVWLWLNANSNTSGSKAFGFSKAELIDMLKDEFAAAKLFYQSFDANAATSPLHSTSTNLGGPCGWVQISALTKDPNNSSYYVYINGTIAVPGYSGPSNTGYGKVTADGTNTLTVLSKYTLAPGTPFYMQNVTGFADAWYMSETETPGVSFTYKVATNVPAGDIHTASTVFYIGKMSAGDYSPYLVSTSAGAAFTASGTTITCTTTNNHNLSVGNQIAVKGTTATTNPPNGVWSVASIVSPTQFTFTAYSAPTGTITAAAGAQTTLYGPNYYLFLMQQSLALYLGQLVTIMKTSGVWDDWRNSATDPTLAADATFVTDWWTRTMTRYSAQFAVDGGLYLEYDTYNNLSYTNWRGQAPGYGTALVITRAKNTPVFSMADTPQSWADVATNVTKEGSEDWLKTQTGSRTERYSGQHMRYQWLHAFRNNWDASYINSIEAGLTTKIDAALALYEAAYTDWKVNKMDVLPPVSGPADTTNGYTRMVNDFYYQHIPAHVYRTPAQVAAGNNSW